MRETRARHVGSIALSVTIVLLTASVAYGAPGGGANWTSSGQNTDNTRYNASERKIGVDNAGDLELLWKLSTPGDVSATPAVDGTTVYVPDFAGNLYAVNRDTGAVRWQKNFTTDYGLEAGDHARATPAIAGNTLILGDQLGKLGPFVDHGNILGIDKNTGALKWKTTFSDVAPIVTQSAVVHGNIAYVGVASFEELWARFLPTAYCCFFRGSIMALDVTTGAILWRTYTAPPVSGGPANDGYTGNAVWGSTPVVDPKRNQLYIATGNNYSVPAAVTACILGGASPPSCLDPGNHFDSILALNLSTGAIKWSARALPSDIWNVSCGLPIPGFDDETPNCPDAQGPDYDFGQGPSLFTVGTGNAKRDLIGAGQKSGTYWALNPDTGQVVWSTQVSPGGVAGGLQWGSATDGKRIYVGNSNSQFKPWTLQGGGGTVNWGGWSALDATTGAILWERPDPNFDRGMGPVSAANGVVYACSMDINGHMYAMDAATGAELWDYPSGASCLGGAAISNGQVFWGTGYDAFSFLPNDNQGLLAFGLPG